MKKNYLRIKDKITIIKAEKDIMQMNKGGDEDEAIQNFTNGDNDCGCGVFRGRVAD